MLSTNNNTTSELRRIAPALNEIAKQVRKESTDVETDMATMGQLIEMVKDSILEEFQIESKLAIMAKSVAVDDKGKYTPYDQFIVTLHDAVIGVQTTEDLIYIKSKYYPMFNAGYDANTDYALAHIDIARLSISAKAIKATRNVVSVVLPWYKRLFNFLFNNNGIERKVDSRGAL